MSNLLPHEAGVIAANIWAKLKASKEPQDLVDGYVVGQDNTTGQAIVTDGATRLKGEAENEVRIFKFATFERAESVAGGRLGKVRVSPSTSSKIGSKGLTQKSQPSRNVDGCQSGGVGGDSTDPARPDIPEAQLPSEPPTEPEPDPPPETIGAIAGASPQNPELSPTPEDTPTGCTTVSDCQWLDAISLDQPCPYGTTKNGATEITAGVFMILCCGEDRPVGDGCPVDSSQLGWTCVNGTCQQTQGGQFATQEECLASGCLKQTWTCTPNGCVEIFNGSGEFSSLEECQQQCAGLGWDCIGGFCQQVSGGRFNTQAECQASGCGAGSADPDTNYCDGFFSSTLTWDQGSITSTNPPINYSIATTAGGILVDWGGGDTELLTGTSADTDPVSDIGIGVKWQFVSGINQFGARTYYYWEIASIDAGKVTAKVNTTDTAIPPDGCSEAFVAENEGNTPTPQVFVIWSVINSVGDAYCGGLGSGYRVTTNTGATSERITETPPTVTPLVSGTTLTVTDASTDVIGTFLYATPPTNFRYSCNN